MPQPPQCAAVSSVFTHILSQNVSPAGQPQAPSVQGKPSSHLVAHLPQWSASVFASVQAPSQMISVARPHLQVPPWHDWPAEQVTPHFPQCSEFELVLTHELPHAVLPAGQPQLPFEQACPPLHLVPQEPQELPVVCKSTQASPQRMRPVGQGSVFAMHLVTAQISPFAQALSQLPQCAGEFKFEHSLPHSCSPGAQAQLPSMQALPPAHLPPQLPQCWASELGS
jgi:hypothetical protein